MWGLQGRTTWEQSPSDKCQQEHWRVHYKHSSCTSKRNSRASPELVGLPKQKGKKCGRGSNKNAIFSFI